MIHLYCVQRLTIYLSPQNGSQFSTAGLRELFQTTHFFLANSTATSAKQANSSAGNSGDIAGGVVGGVVGLVAVAGVLFYFWRRKTKQSIVVSSLDQANGTASSFINFENSVHSLQELEGQEVQELEGQGLQELQQHPVEMEQHPAEMATNEQTRAAFDQFARAQMEEGKERS